MGHMHAQGVSFRWTDDPEAEWLILDTLDEVVTYLARRLDTFHVTFEQDLRQRTFRVWETPWVDALGPKGERWAGN